MTQLAFPQDVTNVLALEAGLPFEEASQRIGLSGSVSPTPPPGSSTASSPSTSRTSTPAGCTGSTAAAPRPSGPPCASA
jgi:hypothetical protein